ncbi:pyridoxamine 5'-phosphate oxidase family protein [Halobacillus naozhouensis]|uniref:Pyridoxamine 5'-phosphate oxidase family protein n=1 Tax=Halobacillus naozhouensis TaxID=554880 RepID=A0ABY8J0T6_9BACI|nr:pyridoxamine 5'-phosphate oxidase family protein [Halobacillus naozhouensis]WFT75207.1 pyridoxamine 5'-phosphate oxidase family protein [Halobacillus naozhouensis]
MNQQALKEKIFDIMEHHQVGTLATVKDGKPYSRFMTFSNDDEFTFFTPTNKETHKAEEIESNPNVYILIGYEGEGNGDAYLEVEGQAKIRDDQDIKDRLWNDRMKRWFSGKDDPEYIVLEIYPESIQLMNTGTDTPEKLEL